MSENNSIVLENNTTVKATKKGRVSEVMEANKKRKKAIKEKRKCYIEYYSKDKKEISARTIHPYDLILLGSEWGVAAYCEKKQEIRHFYINRIKEIKLLENFYN